MLRRRILPTAALLSHTVTCNQAAFSFCQNRLQSSSSSSSAYTPTPYYDASKRPPARTAPRNTEVGAPDDGEYAAMGLKDFRSAPIVNHKKGVISVSAEDMRRGRAGKQKEVLSQSASSSSASSATTTTRFSDIADRVEEVIRKAKMAAGTYHREVKGGNEDANERSNTRRQRQHHGGNAAAPPHPRRFHIDAMDADAHVEDAKVIDPSELAARKRIEARAKGKYIPATMEELFGDDAGGGKEGEAFVDDEQPEGVVEEDYDDAIDVDEEEAHEEEANGRRKKSIASARVDPATGEPLPEPHMSKKERMQRVREADAGIDPDTGAPRRLQEGEKPLPVSKWSGTVDIFDCYENKVSVEDIYSAGGEFTSMTDLAKRVLPKSCGEALQNRLKRVNWNEATALQKTAIPVLMQGRDACIVGPTGTGKTAAYLIPMIARCIVKIEGTEATGANLRAATRNGIAEGTICPKCELDMKANVVCPMTGKFHPQRALQGLDVMDDAEGKEYRQPSTLSELPTVTEPIGIVVVPTSLLVAQVYSVATSLAPRHLRIGYLGKGDSEAARRKIMSAFHGCNLLIATPEQIAAALYKRKLSLRGVRTVAFDEMAVLLETLHFETLKVMLGGLPKGEARPQRAFIGSTFPKIIRDPIRNILLHKNHRVIIASGNSVMDVGGVAAAGKSLFMNHRVQRGSSGGGAISALAAAADPLSAMATSSANTIHTVFMLSRLEKVDKIKQMYASLQLTADQRTVIFCNSFAGVNYLTAELRKYLAHRYNLNIIQCHGKMTPDGQKAAVKSLNSGASTCLVTTDTVGLGLDLQNVTYVVNFDMPNAFSTWVNRVGRCGRMGSRGYSYSFFAPENIRLASPLVKFLRKTASAPSAAGANGAHLFGQQVIPPKLLEYASQDFNDLFAKKNFYDVNKTRTHTREENFVDLTKSNPAKYGHFGRDNQNLTRHRRPET